MLLMKKRAMYETSHRIKVLLLAACQQQTSDTFYMNNICSWLQAICHSQKVIHILVFMAF